MQAFEYAVDLGYRYLETDVQVTADGVLVAFHDNDLLRTTGRAGKISELPWSEVSTALVDGKAPIPLLEDLLGAWPDARVNIDCKSDAAVDALVACLRRTNSLTGCASPRSATPAAPAAQGARGRRVHRARADRDGAVAVRPAAHTRPASPRRCR